MKKEYLGREDVGIHRYKKPVEPRIFKICTQPILQLNCLPTTHDVPLAAADVLRQVMNIYNQTSLPQPPTLAYT